MAHLSVRVAEVGQGPLLTVISIIFLIVFSLKAGLLLYFWLPGSYSAPPTVSCGIVWCLADESWDLCDVPHVYAYFLS